MEIGRFWSHMRRFGNTCYPYDTLTRKRGGIEHLILSEHSEFSNKVDIWSIGCILNELVVGGKAFPSDYDVRSYREPLRLAINGFDEDGTKHISENILSTL